MSVVMRDVRRFYNFLSAEEFSPGPFFLCNSLSIQHLQKRKTKGNSRSVEGVVGHLRGQQAVGLKIVIDFNEFDLLKARLTPMPHKIRTSVKNTMAWPSPQSCPQ